MHESAEITHRATKAQIQSGKFEFLYLLFFCSRGRDAHAGIGDADREGVPEVQIRSFLNYRKIAFFISILIFSFLSIRDQIMTVDANSRAGNADRKDML